MMRAGIGAVRDFRNASADGAVRRGLSLFQIGVLACLAAAVLMLGVVSPRIPWNAAVLIFQLAFIVCAAWRIVLVIVAVRAPPPPPDREPHVWPRYTILAALYDETEVAAQLIERLADIEYPPDRLEAFLLLEAHDLETLDAVMAADMPDWMHVVVVPPGSPGTKPRALNHGLDLASGDLVVIYDAEDDPDPFQLQEAAMRFVDDDDGRLACLQSPLRIRTGRANGGRGGFMQRQFAIEYAALFEITLPAMTRLGMPFPLGGTSNHFRTDVLRRTGGWDAYNVTEDADLGFRLWRQGWRLGVLERPTYETAPQDVEVWLPQRTRWLKGYMQTWGVHTRTLAGLGWRGVTALFMTLGLALASAAMFAATLALVSMSLVMSSAAQVPPSVGLFSLSVLILGVAAAWIQGAVGARRAYTAYSAADMVLAPVYWSMLSLAFVHALWRLIREPHAWDKTRHRRDNLQDGDADALVADAEPQTTERLAAGRQVAGRRAA